MSKAEERFRRAQQAKRKKAVTTPPDGQANAPTDTRGIRPPAGERLPETCRRCGTRHSPAADVQGGLCSACRFAQQRARWAE